MIKVHVSEGRAHLRPVADSPDQGLVVPPPSESSIFLLRKAKVGDIFHDRYAKSSRKGSHPPFFQIICILTRKYSLEL